MRLLTFCLLALYIASIHGWSSSGPMPRRAFVEHVLSAIAVSAVMPAWADENVSGEEESKQDSRGDKEEAARIRKEQAKREKEERRIAEETKKRLAVGRIGTI